MLNKEKHRLMMGRILHDIYSDASIAPLLGFKGGTCAYLFYGLPRFSVDLDFDLIGATEPDKKSMIASIEKILRNYGEIKDEHIKYNTIFLLLSYGDADHNIKFEISTRTHFADLKKFYELKKYLGISMPIASRPYLFASKLAALTLRRKTAMRDIYDIWFFAKNSWDIDADVLKILTGKRVKAHLADCVRTIKQIKDNQILHGLGELMSEKEKDWIRAHLREETVFLLKNYIAALLTVRT